MDERILGGEEATGGKTVIAGKDISRQCEEQTEERGREEGIEPENEGGVGEKEGGSGKEG